METVTLRRQFFVAYEIKAHVAFFSQFRWPGLTRFACSAPPSQSDPFSARQGSREVCCERKADLKN